MKKIRNGFALFSITLSILICPAGYAGQGLGGDNATAADEGVRNKIEQLRASDPVERAAAACALGLMGERAIPAIPHLVALLSDGARIDPAKGCKNEAPFEDEEWQPDYEEVKEPSPGEAATQALVALHEYAMGSLIETVVKGEHWRARKNAAWALAHRANKAGVEALVAALKDEAWQVRAEAAYGLFQRGGAGAPVVAALIVALTDEAWQVRAQAAHAIGHKGSGPTDVVEPLIAALKDADSRVREAAAGGLWHTADGRAFLPLIAALKDDDSKVSAGAAATLGNRVDNRGVELLHAALKDSDPKVRTGARRALEVVKDRARGTRTNLRLPNMPPLIQ